MRDGQLIPNINLNSAIFTPLVYENLTLIYRLNAWEIIARDATVVCRGKIALSSKVAAFRRHVLHIS